MKFRTLKDIEDDHLDCTPIFLTEGMRKEAKNWIKRLSYIVDNAGCNCEYIFCIDCGTIVKVHGTSEEQAAERKKHNFPKEGGEHRTLVYERTYDDIGEFDQFTGAIAAFKLFFNITDDDLKDDVDALTNVGGQE